MECYASAHIDEALRKLTFYSYGWLDDWLGGKISIFMEIISTYIPLGCLCGYKM